MRGQPAKILRPAELRLLLAFVASGRQPMRNRAIVLLSSRAGLRAGEIAVPSIPSCQSATRPISAVEIGFAAS
jgi:integrase/recombinase XerD